MNIQITCADDIRPRFAFGSSSMLPYIEEAGDDVGINDIPEPMPKLRAINQKIFIKIPSSKKCYTQKSQK